MSDVKRIENAKVELTCTVDGDKWQNALKKAFKKLSSNLEVKGFRKGQAPASVVKKHISDDQVNYEAALCVADEALKAACDEHDLDLIDRPGITDVKPSADSCTLVFECPVSPEIELEDYKSIEYKVEEAVVTDEEVEAEVNKLKEQKAELEIKEDGALENGDISVIDFEGFKDGVAFDGGKGENYELTIGSNQFIPGFEEQMIGMKPEEEKEINVTFPENYHVEDLKGQPVVFKVKLHEIKKKVLAEINDELVKELNIKEVETVDQLKEYYKKNLLDTKNYQNKNKAEEDLINALIEKVKVDLPQVMIDREAEQMVNDYGQRFMQQGFTLDQFLQMTGQKIEDLKKNFEPDAVKRIKTTLALKKIATLEKITPTDEEVENYFADMSKNYGMPVEEIKKYVNADQVKSDLKLQKALDLLKK